MHHLVWVVGPEPEEQVRRAMKNSDWCAIGGRFTGDLALNHGAEGKVYGRAVSGLEAEMGTLIAEAIPDATVHLGTNDPAPGVDQARIRDVWLEGSVPPFALVVDSVAYRADENDPEAWGKMVAHDIATKLGVENIAEVPQHVRDVSRVWENFVSSLLDDLHQDDLLTVVDVHE